MKIKSKENSKTSSQTYNLSETATDENVFAVAIAISEITTPTLTGVYSIVERELMDV